MQEFMNRPSAREFISPKDREAMPQELSSGVDRLVDRFEAANAIKSDHIRRRPENYPFARELFKTVLTERNKRAFEVATPEYWDAEALAESLHEEGTYYVLCMDGRVLPVLVFAATYGIGGAIRVPGGLLTEIQRGKDGNMHLKEGSTYSGAIDRAYKEHDVIFQSYDSHIGCAARNAEEEATGRHPVDKGLFSDVLNKREMADATREYVENKYNGKKKLITIQTSFDPHNGFLYMGLETDHALQTADAITKEKALKDGIDPKNIRTEYTDDIISELLNSGKIISTKLLAQDEKIKKLFENQEDFEMNWEEEYVATAGLFWGAISKMKEDALPLIKKRLLEIYPHLESDDKLAKKELNERALLLLVNSFSGYKLNKNEYKYGVHREEFIKVIEGGQPPYPTSAFVLYSLDLQNLPSNIELAAGLIRGSRKKDVVIDKTGNFHDPASFERAVVPIVVHEIARLDLPEVEWKRLSKIKWNDMPEDWDKMSEEDFSQYLISKNIIDARVIKHIDNLRKRMAVLYNPILDLGRHLVDGFKIALPVVTSKDRVNRFVVDGFAKTGY